MRSGAVSIPVWKIATVAFVGLSVAGEESVHQLYERARLLQERNRNLEEAIRIYGRVVERAKDNRALAARAQFEQGILHLRLGRDEQARQAFRKVIVEFPDQPPVVREARARLGVNGSLRSAMSVRQVWAAPDADGSGGPHRMAVFFVSRIGRPATSACAISPPVRSGASPIKTKASSNP
jgi:tetratricopeptide (TPR) repeat protein